MKEETKDEYRKLMDLIDSYEGKLKNHVEQYFRDMVDIEIERRKLNDQIINFGHQINYWESAEKSRRTKNGN